MSSKQCIYDWVCIIKPICMIPKGLAQVYKCLLIPNAKQRNQVQTGGDTKWRQAEPYTALMNVILAMTTSTPRRDKNYPKNV